MNNPQFFISSDERTIACTITSKGKIFKGIAKCMESDVPNLEIGKKLAQYRASLKIRKRDLANIRLVIDCLKGTLDTLDDDLQSKLWSHYLQDACKAERVYLKHTRILKTRIKNLCYGTEL